MTIRSVLVGCCLLLSATGFVVMFVVDAEPSASRPYSIQIGEPGDACSGGSSDGYSQFHFDAATGAGLVCGSGGSGPSGYFTDEEAATIVSASQGFDAHPKPTPNAPFIDEMGQLVGVLFLVIAIVLATLKPRRGRDRGGDGTSTEPPST